MIDSIRMKLFSFFLHPLLNFHLDGISHNLIWKKWKWVKNENIKWGLLWENKAKIYSYSHYIFVLILNCRRGGSIFVNVRERLLIYITCYYPSWLACYCVYLYCFDVKMRSLVLYWTKQRHSVSPQVHAHWLVIYSCSVTRNVEVRGQTCNLVGYVLVRNSHALC